jgi:hypothetical protein
MSIVLISSCKTTQDSNSNTNRCNESNYLNNDFRNITYNDYRGKLNNDTVSVTQMKFNCVFTEFLSKKIMFDEFGKWDEARFKKNQRHPMLVWNNVQLFSDSVTNYVVATYGGGEEDHKIYSSVMVIDENRKDLLAVNSKLRNEITEYFTELIRNNDENKKEFYSIYWRTVDPKFYRKYILGN